MQIFHLGYPKCGSSTIQGLLKADPDLNYLGKPYRSQDAERFVRSVLPFSDLRMLPKSQLAAMRAELCSSEPIISDEILSGVGFMHGIAARSLLQIVDNIDLLTEGDYQAVVVLRRPRSFIHSYHGQIVRMGGRITFDQFCSLLLARRHYWVVQGLNIRAILESEACRSGRVTVALFERLFLDGGLGSFMRTTLGSRALPEQLAARKSNPSDVDSVIDYCASHHPVNPAAIVELMVTEPSLFEHVSMETRDHSEADVFRGLWSGHRARAMEMGRVASATLQQARSALAMHRGTRPDSDMLRRLLAEIARINEGVDVDFPEYGFGQYDYFELA